MHLTSEKVTEPVYYEKRKAKSRDLLLFIRKKVRQRKAFPSFSAFSRSSSLLGGSNKPPPASPFVTPVGFGVSQVAVVGCLDKEQEY
jgi:hypothetical protein